MRRVLATLLGILIAVWPMTTAADTEPEDFAAADEALAGMESDAANGYYTAGEFRHRVLPLTITTVRVALARTSTSETTDPGFNHTAAILSAEGAFSLVKADGTVIGTFAAGTPVTIAAGPDSFTVDGVPYSEPVILKPADGAIALLTYATRVYPGTSSKTYKYHGDIEARPGSAAGTFRLINVVDLEQYLRGLAELPTSWQPAALQAQTIAARSYAAMRIGTPDAIARGFDLYDSIWSQAYNGALRETAKQDQAVHDTAGLVVTYNQQVADTYYSSSSGGHTENNDYVFAVTPDEFRNGPTPVPYLRGKFDGPTQLALDLTTEDGVRTFFSNTYDDQFDSKAVSGNSYYRWTQTWNRTTLETILNTYLRMYGASGWVEPAFPTTGTVGTLTDIKVVGRGTAGKALALEITGTNGTWTVYKEYYIRWILRRTLSSTLLSANFFLDITRDAGGAITQVKATGGGYGHGVGMDQYGVRGMASLNYNVAQILEHYYTGAGVTTVPLNVRRVTGIPMDQAFRQQFFSPTGGGTLMVTDHGLKNLQAVVNGHVVTVNAADCTDALCQVDISPWMQPGLNEVIYVPLGAPEGSAVVTVSVR
jgi:SpoIID/LytB domain protein